MPPAEPAYSLVPPGKPNTIAQLIEEWLSIKARSISEQALKDLRTVTRRWIRHFGHLPPDDVGPREIQRVYLERDTGRLSNATLNCERRHLRGFWIWLRRLQYATGDPTGIWPLKNPRKRRRKYIHVDPVWEARILTELKERFRRFLVFAITTGLRYGEIKALLWAWVDADGLLIIPGDARKQGEPHRLPLPRRALEALGPPGDPHHPIFPDIPMACNVARALKRAARRAGYHEWKHISSHQLRRSWLGRLSRARVPREALKDLGGWNRESVMVEFYWSRIGDDEARGYLERI